MDGWRPHPLDCYTAPCMALYSKLTLHHKRTFILDRYSVFYLFIGRYFCELLPLNTHKVCAKCKIHIIQMERRDAPDSLKPSWRRDVLCVCLHSEKYVAVIPSRDFHISSITNTVSPKVSSPTAIWWIQSLGQQQQFHPFISVLQSISNRWPPWPRGMESAGGAFSLCWHPLQPYLTAANQERPYCKVLFARIWSDFWI